MTLELAASPATRPQATTVLLADVPAVVLLLDADGRVQAISRELAGQPAAAWRGRRLADGVTAETREALEYSVRDALSPGLGHTCRVAFVHAEHAPCWYRLSVGPVHLRDGVGPQVAVVAQDITAEHAELERLQRSERLMRDTEGVAQLGVWEWDVSQPYVEWSDHLFTMFGLEKGQHRPSYQDYLSRVHPDDRARVQAAMERVFQQHQPYNHDERIWRADGELRHLHTWGEPVLDERGQLLRMVGVCQDITDRKRAEEERDRLLARERAAHAAAEAARGRAAFLATAGRVLAPSRSRAAVLEQTARLAVPALADFAALLLVGEEHEPRRVLLAHAAEDGSAQLQALEDVPLGGRAAFGMRRVLAGSPPERREVELEREADADPALEAAREAGHARGSYLCVPVRVGGHTEGVLSLVTVAPREPFAEEDQVLAESLANRAATALDNAHLLRAARDAVRVRDDFLSVASHELRTPLTALKLQLAGLESAAQALAPGPAQRLVERRMDAVRRQVDRLQRLVGDLLDVSRLAVEEYELSVQDGDLVALLRRVVDGCGRDASRAGCSLQLTAPEALVGRWDLPRLELALGHLLSNAVKYGAGRPVDVTVDAPDDTVRVSVRDRGIGIHPDDLERIFARFERAVSVHHYGGLGLGLYLARRIAEAHGGQLRVESAPGRGSTFTLELPRATATATLAAAAAGGLAAAAAPSAAPQPRPH